jgi:perosamine synthetase
MDFFSTTISDKSIQNVINVLSTTMISAGKMADRFESELNKKFNFNNSITLNSGTVTMFLALKASGVGYGDEVILPAQTFVATGHVILQCGAKPVFADINLDGNISVESIKSKITERTKAIIPVHWGGYPCDMDEINKIATENNLIVIEDAAHALGSKYKGEYIGNISDFTSFSFQAIKHLTTGDGGLLTCKNEDKYNLIKRLRWFDIDRENSPLSILGEREYDIVNVGYKSHMNDIAASIGLGNLEGFDDKLTKIKNIANIYNNELKNIGGLKVLNYKTDRESSYWLYPVLVDNRIDFIKKLSEYKIPTSVVHIGIDKNSLFGGKNYDLVNQRFFDDNQIHLPINEKLTENDINLITKTIKNGW